MEYNWANSTIGSSENNYVTFYPLGPPTAVANPQWYWSGNVVIGSTNKVPHKCPICLGYGKVSWFIDENGNMISSIWYMYKCPAACINGILWG